MIKSLSDKKVINLICKEQAMSEFPYMLVGTSVDTGIHYFDATYALEKQGFAAYSAESFLQNYFHPISALITAYGLDKDQVCVKNHEGHLLIDCSLIFLFICYTNPDFLAHVNDRIGELFTRGFCVSDSFLYQWSRERLSPEVLRSTDNGTRTAT